MRLHVVLAAPPGPESDAAWAWLAGCEAVAARRVEPAGLASALADADVAWVHAATDPGPVPVDALARFAAAGGGVVLSLRAAALPVPMGIEAVPPNEVAEERWRHVADPYWTPAFHAMAAYPHIRGLATWGPHPLVEGLHNGTYCWTATEGEPWVWCGYTGGVRPSGRVVGVERAYIAQDPRRIVAWEYELGAGVVLCLGAHLLFAAPDRTLRAQLERLALNALRAAASPGGERSAWPTPGALAGPDPSLDLPSPFDLTGALPPVADEPPSATGPAEFRPYDLAGRRLLLVGRETAGTEEMWVHPHRVVASWDVAVDGAPAAGADVAITADVVVRELEGAHRRVTETTFVALEHPVAVVEYAALRRRRETAALPPPSVEVTVAMDLRRAWPFAAGCGGDLRFHARPDGRVVMVTTASGDGVAALLLDRPAAVTVRAVRLREAQGVECAISAALDLPLRIAVAGGVGRADFDRALGVLRRQGVQGLVRQRLLRAATLREARLAVRSADPRLDAACAWAVRRLDACVGDVPGVGRSLFAGYAASQPGWSEARPGYAWFFGRDACWTAFAQLAAGEFGVPRQVLRFLGDRQDVTGKVLHEATTSGQFHYDAADSTPLYLLLAARYLAWSGDVAFIRAIWPRLRQALAFCLSTDRDGDGLIENTGVGHGWIESGPLGGAHVTLYLAAVWHAALIGMAEIAAALGEGALAGDCRVRAARAAETITRDFHDPAGGRWALDRRADGARTWTPTATHSAAILLGAVAPEAAEPYLDALAGDAFTAAWGVRMLACTDPLFDPKGYHSGSVWPLFTGWAALAEFRAGRVSAAWRHLMATAGLATVHQRGAFPEVLHGLTGEVIGVCPDQAWSAGAVLSPLVEGLLGVAPDAPRGRLALAPALPGDLERLDVHGLRVGETVYDIRLRRQPGWLDVGARRMSGPPLWITLAPWLEAAPGHVAVDGVEVTPRLAVWGRGVRAEIGFQAAGETAVRFTNGDG